MLAGWMLYRTFQCSTLNLVAFMLLNTAFQCDLFMLAFSLCFRKFTAQGCTSSVKRCLKSFTLNVTTNLSLVVMCCSPVSCQLYKSVLLCLHACSKVVLTTLYSNMRCGAAGSMFSNSAKSIISFLSFSMSLILCIPASILSLKCRFLGLI